MRIYGLKNCDSCRKAKKALPGAELVELRETAVPDDLLHRAYAEFGDALINTRSTTWRNLDEAARSLPPLALIRAGPTVMKRPLIEVKDRLFLGWNKDIEQEVHALL
ncbi:ArsC/Spx/MgsR family protein [Sulfitobacter sp. PS-8MA]|uniref:ArsC/Spx/MgsR family protein n=1 Tax=Sulfitobacter sp. PS-8MA TaxID=3237707 RepID=UPI0034C60B6D